MSKLSLTLACGPYAHTYALQHDKVPLEGIDLTFLPIESPPEIFTRMLANHAFDACEMSLSHYFRHRPAIFRSSPFRFFRCGSSATALSSSIRTAASASRRT